MIKPGQKFGELTALKESSERIRKSVAWECQCSCGNKVLVNRYKLLDGQRKSCGCLKKRPPKNTLNLTGKTFGKLTVIELAGRTKNENTLWLCHCECGNTTTAMGTSLRRGDTVSCGCSKDSQINNAKRKLQQDYTVDGVQVPLLTKKVRSDSRTGHKGVTCRKRGKREVYEVNITVKGKRKFLGSHKDLDSAIAARKRAEEEYHQPYIKKLKEKDDDKKH